jgi:putative hemolysin
MILAIGAMLLVVLLIAWLTAGAVSVRSVSRIWLRHWAERRPRGSRGALMYLAHPQRLLAGSGAGVAVALVLAGAELGGLHHGVPLIAMLVPLALVAIVVGQIIPRALARRWSSLIVPATLPVLHGAAILARPLTAFGRWLATPWLPPRADQAPEADHDIVHDLLREGEMEGVGEREEIKIIGGVVDFSEKRVGDVMTPRADTFALDESLSPRALAEQIALAGYSRVPIYRGSVDHIVGMVHAFDVLKAGGDAFPRIRRVRVAAPDDPCNELLFRMLRERMHLAIVSDAAGQTVGLVTLEDLFEELVGDIRDEHDEPEAPRGVNPV